MKSLSMLSWWLVIVGALNWGLVGAFGLDLVAMLLGAWPMLVTLVYVLVGLSAVHQLWGHMMKSGK